MTASLELLTGGGWGRNGGDGSGFRAIAHGSAKDKFSLVLSLFLSTATVLLKASKPLCKYYHNKH